MSRLGALCVVLAACGGASSPELALPSPRADVSGPPFESPARWASYPEEVGTPTSTLVLPDGRCLVLTDDGQRWLVEPTDKSKPCAGRGTASGSPSVEALHHAEKLPDAYRFVGDGGVIYTARDPVGPFERSVRAPTFLVRVAAGGGAVVGVDRAGKTFHFADGGWKPSNIPSRALGIDVTVDAAGRALWLGAPEEVKVSTDGGRTFTPVAGAPSKVGPWQAALFDRGKLGLIGVAGNLVLEGDRLVRSPSKPDEAARADVAIEPERGPKESLIRSGTAALTGKTYYEVIERGEGGSRYALLRAELGGKTETIPLADVERCDAVRIAANGQSVALACMAPHESREDLSLRLGISNDGGKTFKTEASLLAQTFGDVHLTLSRSGAVLVTGACAPDEDEPTARPSAPSAGAAPRARPHGGACSPKAPLLLRRERNRYVMVAGSGVQIEQGSARSPILSPDGRFAYVLARTRREGRMALFASRDGGRTYTERRIELLSTGWEWGDEVDASPAEVDRVLSIPERARLTIDDTGSLGMACDGASGPVWITLDSEGRVQNAERPPQTGAQLGGQGARVLAVGFGTDDVLHAWESLDGGNNFTEIAVTQAVQRFATHGDWAMACSSGGCVLGDELVRVGWEGQAETPFEVTEETFATPDISLSTPISCRLAPKSEWTKVTGAAEDGAPVPHLPRLRDLARGKTAWSVVAIEPSGKVVVAGAAMPENTAEAKDRSLAPIVTKPLLGPPPSKDTAFVVKPQAEGFVAMRARVPRAKGGGVDTRAPLENVELAWQNQYLGVTARRTVRFDEPWSNALVSGSRLRPLLLTITAGSVTVQPTTKRAYAFDAQSGTTAFDYPDWQALLSDRRELSTFDAALIGGAPAAVAFLDRSPAAQVVAVARPAKGAPTGYEIEAVTLAAGSADLEWAAAGEASGFAAVTTGSATTERADAWLFGDKGLAGEPIALARLAHLADRVTPCTVEQRRTSPRSVSTHFARSGALVSTVGRRPILVQEPASTGGSFGAALPDSQWLLSDGAILHGSPAEPCVAVWKGSAVYGGAVAVIAGDLEHAWLLKTGVVESTTRGQPVASAGPPVRGLLARPMSCKVDPTLIVPADVASRAGHRLSDDQP